MEFRMAIAKKNPKADTKKKTKKTTIKLKKATKRAVAKHSKTAKKGIKKLVKKAVAKTSKATKKVIRKHGASLGKNKKTTARIEKQARDIMKPIGDIAVAVIDAVDNAMHSVMDVSTKKKR
jgi:pyruvate-formate lyase